MLPAPIAASFEVIDPEFVFEFPGLLFDGPPTARDRDERAQRGGGLEVEQIVFPFVVEQRARAQEPAVAAAGRAVTIAAAVRVRRAPGVHIVSTDRMARP